MDESANSKRLILATGLCLLVMVLGQWLMPAKRVGGSLDGGAADGLGVAGTSSTAGSALTTATANSTAAATAPVAGAVAQAGTGPAAGTTMTKPHELKKFDFAGAVPDEKGHHTIPFETRLTNLGGGIEQFSLPTYHERNEKNQPTDQPIQLADAIAGVPEQEAAMLQMAGVSFRAGTTFSTPPVIPFEVVEASPSLVRYRYRTGEGVAIEREYSFRSDSFEIELAVTVKNDSKVPQSHRLNISSALRATEAMKKGSGFFANFIPPADHLDGLCFSEGSVKRVAQATLAGEPQGERLEKGARWVAADRQYFVSAIVLRDRAEAACALRAQGSIVQASLEMPEVVLEPGQEKRHKFTAYLGVKKPALLTLLDAELESAVDYRILGMNLAPLCAGLLWILALFHGLTGSWGVAILGLTVLVKLVLFPLNQRSGKSMRGLSQLKPAMEEIKKKFPDDRQRQSEELMKLYRQHGVNPAGGCLPILIQMPIWFALYRSLWSSVDLYQQGFLWLKDLTTPDPYWVLPVLLIIVMFLQQRMTPTTMDAAQQKMMQYTMPLVFGAMMIALPSGLCFYILVNSVLTIVQQHLINRTVGPVGGLQSVRGAPA